MSERIIFCTPAERATSPWSKPVDAVGDRPVVEQRREHLVHALLDAFEAVDVEEGLLLAGKRGVGRSSAVAEDRTAHETAVPYSASSFA